MSIPQERPAFLLRVIWSNGDVSHTEFNSYDELCVATGKLWEKAAQYSQLSRVDQVLQGTGLCAESTAAYTLLETGQ